MFMNESKVDRAARVILGLLIISLAFWGPATPAGYLGIVPLLTGIVGFCPIYRILGITTHPQ